MYEARGHMKGEESAQPHEQQHDADNSKHLHPPKREDLAGRILRLVLTIWDLLGLSVDRGKTLPRIMDFCRR